MSTSDDRTLDEHASLHLDGEISDAEWQRLSAEHGDALVVAVARERSLRGAIRSLPRAPAPLAVREA
ncbi:MAG: hypothetical protein H0W83_17010, partial [Planctomycetes bacterium]|nr:hypothetical protein [Planctomycetota bacterium]